MFNCYWSNICVYVYASLWPTFPNVLSGSPDFLRNWAASPADILPVFAGSSYKEPMTKHEVNTAHIAVFFHWFYDTWSVVENH